MTHEQFENAAQYWNKKEQVKMPKEALKSANNGGSNEPDLCDADQDGSIMFGI